MAYIWHMQLDAEHLKALRDVAAFGRIKRYHGMLPAKLAMFLEESKLKDLLQAGYIERLHVSFSCGSETKLLKLTDKGEELVARLRAEGTLEDTSPPVTAGTTPPNQSEAGEEHRPALEPLTREQLIILNDIYHFSKITRFGGIMPLDKLKEYAAADINTLYGRGFIIRVKAEVGAGAKRKGYILSDKGAEHLKSLNLL